MVLAQQMQTKDRRGRKHGPGLFLAPNESRGHATPAEVRSALSGGRW